MRLSALTGTFVSIAGGYYHSLAARSDGVVWTWGFNGTGQLGDGTVGNRATPSSIGTPSSASRVAADGSTSFVLRSDATVWGWGYNPQGVLGDVGTVGSTKVPPSQLAGLTGVLEIEPGYFHAVARLNDHTVRTWGGNDYGAIGDGTTTPRLTPVAVPGVSGVLAVGAGQWHTAALTGEGTVWSWGYNFYGQVGDGTTGTSRPSPVAVTFP